MTGPLKTRFSYGATKWYEEYLEQEMYNIDPPEVEVLRIVVVGARHRDIPEDIVLDDPLVLEPEPNNKFDSKAIRVLYRGEQIGYIPRKETAYFHATEFKQEGDMNVLPKVISGPDLVLYVVKLPDSDE